MTIAPAQLLLFCKKDTIATFIRTSYYLNRSNSLSMQFGVLVYNLHVLSKQSCFSIQTLQLLLSFLKVKNNYIDL